MPDIILKLAAFIGFYKYFLLIPSTIIQGPLTMLASGFFVKLGVFEFLPAYLALMAGDFTGDVLWYFVGRKWAHPFIRRFGKWFGLTEDKLARVEGAFRRHQIKILFTSKITSGFGFGIATLISAGALRVPFKKYVATTVFGGLMWIGMMMLIGHTIGQAYLSVDHFLKNIFLTSAVVMAILALFGFSVAMWKNYNNSKSTNGK